MRFLCKKYDMQVLVIADDDLKQELLCRPVDPATRLTWIERAEEPEGRASFDACIDLLFQNTQQRIEWLNRLHVPLVVVNSVIDPLTVIGQPFVRMNGWRTFLQGEVIEAAGERSNRAHAEELFTAIGRKTAWVPDITGFIRPRVVASIINEAFFALEEKISSREDIDTAMKLGTNYPLGPFEWSEKIGLKHVCSLLSALSKEQERYTPSLLLQQTA